MSLMQFSKVGMLFSHFFLLLKKVIFNVGYPVRVVINYRKKVLFFLLVSMILPVLTYFTYLSGWKFFTSVGLVFTVLFWVTFELKKEYVKQESKWQKEAEDWEENKMFGMKKDEVKGDNIDREILAVDKKNEEIMLKAREEARKEMQQGKKKEEVSKASQEVQLMVKMKERMNYLNDQKKIIEEEMVDIKKEYDDLMFGGY